MFDIIIIIIIIIIILHNYNFTSYFVWVFRLGLSYKGKNVD